ncbi:hypothetical protein QFC22_005420 [Naganishia vaughanmartiniae]|uniref:Uncharacterized protein n=1 Tax=Naganishia vaughanmartiniae TaxID=1424756 RepID=A0ACC2WVN0_9TREE|nr:hypothetical protein QFC22_005420 [Naganishia vaughanmartiniae]
MLRNTEDNASSRERNMTYDIDENLRNVVQTAPVLSGMTRSVSPSLSGAQEEHTRKRARLDKDSRAPLLESPVMGDYNALPNIARGPHSYISESSYGYPSTHTSTSYNTTHYRPSTYAVPASAPASRDIHAIHNPSSSTMGDANDSGYPAGMSGDFAGLHQSRMSVCSIPLSGPETHSRSNIQSHSGYTGYAAMPVPASSAVYATGPTAGSSSNVGMSDSPQTPLVGGDSRHWSHAYGVPSAGSPDANLPMSGVPRHAPQSRGGLPFEQQPGYYSRSYPPYEEQSIPEGLSASPYQQSTPQFLSPEAGPSVFRGEAQYPSGSSAPRSTGPTTPSTGQTGAKSQALFVSKLYNMLEDSEIVASGLLKWSADGQGFICADPNEFARLFLSKYFKHANWHSFVRQLNMYGFNKQVNDVFQTLSQPADQPIAWEFRHAIFRRGDPSCVHRIKRRSVKNNSTAPRDMMSSQIARPPGMPGTTTATSMVYPPTYQPATYASEHGMHAAHHMMTMPRYSTGSSVDSYGMPGGYMGGSGMPQGPGGQAHAWMAAPNTQYPGRGIPPPHSYPSSGYMGPPDNNQSSSQRSTSSLPSRTTESYTRQDRPGRPY